MSESAYLKARADFDAAYQVYMTKRNAWRAQKLSTPDFEQAMLDVMAAQVAFEKTFATEAKRGES